MNTIIRLKGGLGNQMFQYATAYAIAREKHMVLVLDTRSGFERDKVFKRRFSLHKLGIVAHTHATWLNRFLFVLVSHFPVLLIVFKKPGLGTTTITNQADLAFQAYFSKNIQLDGYWQSYMNFQPYRQTLFEIFSKNLEVPQELVSRFNIDFENDVAVCMRFFEELLGDNTMNLPTDTAFYQKAIASIAGKGIYKLIVFSSDSTRAVKYLSSFGIVSGDYHLLTSDLGYEDEVKILALMSHFKHLIISNSSFYWWAGWLAGMRNNNTIVLAPKNCAVHNYYPEQWILI